jgi:hypothetical protein
MLAARLSPTSGFMIPNLKVATNDMKLREIRVVRDHFQGEGLKSSSVQVMDP